MEELSEPSSPLTLPTACDLVSQKCKKYNKMMKKKEVELAKRMLTKENTILKMETTCLKKPPFQLKLQHESKTNRLLKSEIFFSPL